MAKPKKKNGIIIRKGKNNKVLYELCHNGRIISNGEPYERKAGVMRALKRSWLILNEYFTMNDTSVLHDDTLVKK